MSVYWDKTKGRWRFTFNRIISSGPNRRRYRATKLLPKGWSQRQAEKYDQQQGAALYAQNSGVEPGDQTISGAVLLYIKHHLPDLRDKANIERELAHLFPKIKGQPLSAAPDVAHAYADEQRGELAPATIRNRLAYLKAAIRYAWRRHSYGDQNYSQRIILPTVKNERQRYEKVDTVRKLLAKIRHQEDRAVFTLAFWCGLRWRASVLPRVPTEVIRNGRDVWLVAGITKNGTPRMKYVPVEARWALAFLPFDDTRHWRTRYASYEDAVAAMKLEDWTAHDMRHALASAIISGGKTLTDVGAALDHDSVVSSKRYSHLYQQRLKEVMRGVSKPARRRQKNAHPKKAAAARSRATA